MKTLSPWLKKNALVAYFTLAYLITWTIWSPLLASSQGWVSWKAPGALFYFGSFGPMLSALVITALTSGRAGLFNLASRIVKWRVPLRYYAIVLLAPIVLFLIAILLSYMLGHQWPDLALLGKADYLPVLDPLGTLALWLVTSGLGEETGWRGFALPHLQKTRSAVSASLLLAILWAGWHLPLFFFWGNYVGMGLIGFPMFAFLMIFTALVFTWLYNGTGGSLFLVIVFHGIFNWLTATDAGGQFAQAFLSAPVVLWALYVARRYGQENAAPLPRQVPSN